MLESRSHAGFWFALGVACTACGGGGGGSSSTAAGQHEDGGPEGAGPSPSTGGSRSDGRANSGPDASRDAAAAATRDGGAQPTGGDFLAGEDGIAATVDGTLYAFTANVQWGILPNANTGQMVAFKPMGSAFDSVTRWDIRSFPPEVGTHPCQVGGAEIRLTLGGAAYGAESCTLEITSVNDVAIEGTFSATLADAATGQRFGSATDGVFRKRAPNSGGGALGAGEDGATFTVDGTPYELGTPNQMFQEQYIQMRFGTLGLLMLPNQTGTLHCGDGPPYRQVAMTALWEADTTWYDANPDVAGSACTITLTKVGAFDADGVAYHGTLEGTFSATMASKTGGTLDLEDGEFRYTAP